MTDREIKDLKTLMKESGYKDYVLHTGHKGLFNFDTFMIIGSCNEDFKLMRDKFIETRDKQYNAEEELHNYKHKVRNIWFLKLLIKLKLIKI